MLDNIRVEDIFRIRISRYCQKDVLAIGQVILRFINMPYIKAENIESVTFDKNTLM